MKLFRLFALFALLLVATLAVAPSASADCTPSDTQVALFKGANFTGDCKVKSVGDYANQAAIGMTDNTISSIKVGSKVRARLYRDINFGGVSELFQANDADLSNNVINTNDTSSMKIEYRPCNPGAEEVALYDGLNFTGACVELGVGDYANLANQGMANKASSVKVGAKVQVRLYRDTGFGGVSSLFSANADDLDNFAIGRNTAQSAKVDFRPCPSPGAYEVTIYEGKNYTGRCVVKGVGQFDNAAEMGISNNTLSSLKVGANVKAILYHDANFGGASQGFTSNDSDLSTNTIGNNTVSSMKVTCEPNANQVALFNGLNYTGSCIVKGIGEYQNHLAIGMPDNTVSSVKVGANVKVRLYRDANFAGVSSLLTSSQPNLATIAVDSNTTSSIKVQAD